MKNKKRSYKEIILEIAKDKQWHPTWHFICKYTRFGWLGTSGDRRCRELANDGILRSQLVNGNVMYHIA